MANKQVKLNRRQVDWVKSILEQPAQGTRHTVRDIRLLDLACALLDQHRAVYPEPPAGRALGAGEKYTDEEQKQLQVLQHEHAVKCKAIRDEEVTLDMPEGVFVLVRERLAKFNDYNPTPEVRKEVIKIADAFGIE